MKAPYDETDEDCRTKVLCCPECESENLINDTPKGSHIKMYICKDCEHEFNTAKL